MLVLKRLFGRCNRALSSWTTIKLIASLLLMVWILSCESNPQSTPERISKRKNNSLPDESQALVQQLYSDSTYLFGNSNLTIQNGFPRGGIIDREGTIGYTDYSGKKYAFGLFWTRIVNENNSPLKFKIEFHDEPTSLIFPFDAHIRLYVLPDTMTIEKLAQFNYGVDGIKSFLDTHFNQITNLDRVLASNEASFFNIILLFDTPNNDAVRSEMIIKEHDLYYKVRVSPYGEIMIPCGKVEFLD